MQPRADHRRRHGALPPAHGALFFGAARGRHLVRVRVRVRVRLLGAARGRLLHAVSGGAGRQAVE